MEGPIELGPSRLQPPPPQGEAPLPQPPLQLEAVPSSPPPPPPSSDLKTRTECPVCHEDYTLPKLLPCNHLACQHCIVDWLHKTDQKGGCPLCRTPILPEDPYRLFRFPQNDPLSLVDAMPTDMTMVGLVEGGKILNSRNVCQLCDSNYSSASSSFYFCLQCPMKLCHSCVKVHAKIPGLKKHVVEALSELTPERLAQVNRCKCGRHEDRMADMYCPAHRELICTPCARKEHWGCGGVMEVQEAAKERREELTAEAKELMVMETAMKTQAKALSSKFQAMRQETNQVFDQIQNGVETRRHEILSRVKAEEDKMALPQLDVDRSTVTSSAAVIGRWVQSAPDDALLEMTDRMRPRLTDLKQRITQENRVCRAELVFDSGALTQLESAVGGIGQVRQVQQPTLPNPPSAAITAREEKQLATPLEPREVPSGLESKPVARARRATSKATPLDVTPPATRPDVTPTAAPLDVTLPAARPDVTPTATPLDITLPATRHYVTPNATPLDVTLPATYPGVTTTATPLDVTLPATYPGVTPTATPLDVTLPATYPGVTRSVTPRKVIEPATPSNPARDSSWGNLTGPATSGNHTGPAPWGSLTGQAPSGNHTGPAPWGNLTGQAPSGNYTGPAPWGKLTSSLVCSRGRRQKSKTRGGGP